MTLDKLLEGVKVLKTAGNSEIQVNNVCMDSRKVGKGDMFICIPGNVVDGHIFASEAVEKGASVIVCERSPECELDAVIIVVEDARKSMALIASNFYGNPASELKLIGVTGTNGKTTTTYLVKSILEGVGKKTGLIGTNQNLAGDEVLPASHTTPDCLEFHSLLRKMKDCGCEYVVMEVSSHALCMHRVYGCRFEAAGFTNLTPEHIDYHKSMESYFEAKKMLFDICRCGVVNFDDEYGKKLIELYPGTLSGFSVKESSWLTVGEVKLLSDSVRFTINHDGAEYEFSLAIPGEFSVYNAALAVGLCLRIGVGIDECHRGIASAKGVCGRIEVVPVNKDYTVIIDYAHTPDGLLNILKAVRGFCRGRLILLFGCGGDRDKTKRPVMGEIAVKSADFCIITSDNPRTESPRGIIDDIIKGIPLGCGDKYVVIENRFDAIKHSLSVAKKDDVVLLAGKGHENYQILKDKTIDFDEHEIVRSLVF